MLPVIESWLGPKFIRTGGFVHCITSYHFPCPYSIPLIDLNESSKPILNPSDVVDQIYTLIINHSLESLDWNDQAIKLVFSIGSIGMNQRSLSGRGTQYWIWLINPHLREEWTMRSVIKCDNHTKW